MAKLFLTLTILLLALISVSPGRATKRKTGVVRHRLVARPLYLQACPDVPQKVVYNTIGVITVKGENSVVFHIDAEVPRKFETIEKVLVTFNVCSETEDRCQYYHTWRFGRECCRLMTLKGVFWTPLFSTVDPPLRCPILPGHYVMQNGTIDAELAQNLFPVSLENNVWKTRFDIFDYERVMCVDFAIRFLRVRQGH